jgi:hypothetical protein
VWGIPECFPARAIQLSLRYAFSQRVPCLYISPPEGGGWQECQTPRVADGIMG